MQAGRRAHGRDQWLCRRSGDRRSLDVCRTKPGRRGLRHRRPCPRPRRPRNGWLADFRHGRHAEFAATARAGLGRPTDCLWRRGGRLGRCGGRRPRRRRRCSACAYRGDAQESRARQSHGGGDAGARARRIERAAGRGPRAQADGPRINAHLDDLRREEASGVIDFPIIDSHIHLLDQKRFADSWAKDAPTLKRDWTPDELANAAKPYELEGLVFVEVDVDMPQYLDEAEWVDGLAAQDRRVLGAVVCLPLERGAAIEPEIARVAKLKTVRGVRRLIQNQPDSEFMLKPGFLEALRLLPKYNLSFDACILHPQMPNTLAMMRHCPEVSFILDHIGKPGIKAGLIDPWRAQIREMAALPNVMCKLAGVTTEADLKTWTRDQLRPYIDHVIECFGPDRILYGGDWPVSELAGGYLQWLSTLDWATAGFSPAEKRKLFRDNAIKAYRLGA